MCCPTFFALVAERCHSSTDPSGLIAPGAVWFLAWRLLAGGVSWQLRSFSDLTTYNRQLSLVSGSFEEGESRFSPHCREATGIRFGLGIFLATAIAFFLAFLALTIAITTFEHVVQGQQRWIFQTECLWIC